MSHYIRSFDSSISSRSLFPYRTSLTPDDLERLAAVGSPIEDASTAGLCQNVRCDDNMYNCYPPVNSYSHGATMAEGLIEMENEKLEALSPSEAFGRVEVPTGSQGFTIDNCWPSFESENSHDGVSPLSLTASSSTTYDNGYSPVPRPDFHASDLDIFTLTYLPGQNPTSPSAQPTLACEQSFQDMNLSPVAPQNHATSTVSPQEAVGTSRRKVVHRNVRNQSLRRRKKKPGRPLYPCHICGDDFTTKHNLRYHLNIHEDIKPYKPGCCDKSFRTSSDSKRHAKKCGPKVA